MLNRKIIIFLRGTLVLLFIRKILGLKIVLRKVVLRLFSIFNCFLVV